MAASIAAFLLQKLGKYEYFGLPRGQDLNPFKIEQRVGPALSVPDFFQRKAFTIEQAAAVSPHLQRCKAQGRADKLFDHAARGQTFVEAVSTASLTCCTARANYAYDVP